jgi:hypothetical protein
MHGHVTVWRRGSVSAPAPYEMSRGRRQPISDADASLALVVISQPSSLTTWTLDACRGDCHVQADALYASRASIPFLS